jgi:hypothetical protein
MNQRLLNVRLLGEACILGPCFRGVCGTPGQIRD